LKVNLGHITYKVVFVRYELLKVEVVGYQITHKQHHKINVHKMCTKKKELRWRLDAQPTTR